MSNILKLVLAGLDGTSGIVSVLFIRIAKE